ncbi:MAG: hypothetical protein GX799_08455 [Crenarchaeota archaeon]|nr:hypothetical protein [Thermoproteota archaeon]
MAGEGAILLSLGLIPTIGWVRYNRRSFSPKCKERIIVPTVKTIASTETSQQA